ncbi:DUF2809 domain-containing protein [Paenibacillus sp. GSMTC-2017]|uniref:ribosomal maturation YjgA family protein n=1 Tax=Paenibacillus sp. GSMTC-2017 TaxID=2794350 RepID=UPI0018D67D95|nr:DUF2809 domain-containing protein [Paenibacillus sp. GSMTC-2017]MBH5318853.1 DUF2809 domain-containing protein [Paenibacillus sp. GSMTC-2017]
MNILKVRLGYLAVTNIILVAGLSTRQFAEYLPAFVASHFGDALWAAMIYCGFRTLAVTKKLEWALMLSIIFCVAIECSQLYQADWINHIRDTLIGGLILGNGYLSIDLVRYGVGILVAYIIDRMVSKPINT